MVFNGSGTQTIVTVIQGVNDITQGLFGVFFVLIVGLITYGMLASEPTRETFVASSFVMMVTAILLGVMGIVEEVTIGLTVAVFVGSLIMLIIRQ